MRCPRREHRLVQCREHNVWRLELHAEIPIPRSTAIFAVDAVVYKKHSHLLCRAFQKLRDGHVPSNRLGKIGVKLSYLFHRCRVILVNLDWVLGRQQRNVIAIQQDTRTECRASCAQILQRLLRERRTHRALHELLCVCRKLWSVPYVKELILRPTRTHITHARIRTPPYQYTRDKGHSRSRRVDESCVGGRISRVTHPWVLLLITITKLEEVIHSLAGDCAHIGLLLHPSVVINGVREADTCFILPRDRRRRVLFLFGNTWQNRSKGKPERKVLKGHLTWTLRVLFLQRVHAPHGNSAMNCLEKLA